MRIITFYSSKRTIMHFPKYENENEYKGKEVNTREENRTKALRIDVIL